MVGHPSSGKTSLIQRFAQNDYFEAAVEEEKELQNATVPPLIRLNPPSSPPF